MRPLSRAVIAHPVHTSPDAQRIEANNDEVSIWHQHSRSRNTSWGADVVSSVWHKTKASNESVAKGKALASPPRFLSPWRRARNCGAETPAAFSKLAKQQADIGTCHNGVVAEYVLQVFTQLRGELID